jgi:hypothetical protein
MNQPTIINKFGTLQGWNSITVNFLGRDLEGITELAYEDDQDKKNAFGGGGLPVGRTRGNIEAKCSITLFKEEVDALKKALPKGKALRDIRAFDIVAQYEMEDTGEILKDRIRNAEFRGDGVEVKQGDGSIARKYDLIISHIEWNI